MSSIHIAHNIQKQLFGRFTRKAFHQQIFDEACKDNKAVLENLKPSQCGLKELFPKVRQVFTAPTKPESTGSKA